MTDQRLTPCQSKGLVTKWKSMFPGLGFAAGYKVAQRTYKFGGQPYARELVNSLLGNWPQETFGKKNGKVLVSATAGSMMGVGEVLLLPLDGASLLTLCMRPREKD